MNKKFETFNDGMLVVYSVKPKKTDFSAAENIRAKDSLTKVLKFAYEEKSKRDRDLEYAVSRGRTLSLKVKTRLNPIVNAKHKILIGNVLYSIINIDSDRQKNVMYFYLEEERCVQ